mmetsp:Transcript_7015/g.22471  ORF Transcript_7015/g.22471 Transcript_7015/m.22471 type:complete len:264 (-) Transcript_7015:27-818(-)
MPAILVTGGASGLGAATIEHFVTQLGYDAIIADISSEAGEALASKLSKATQRTVIFVHCNVMDDDAVRVAIEKGVSQLPSGSHLEVVLAAAGGSVPSRLVRGSTPERAVASDAAWFEKIVRLNLLGAVSTAKYAALHMAPQKKGLIVFVASVAATEGQIGQTPYSAGKAGLVGVTLPLARELARFGIRVMTIAPGVMETPMLGPVGADHPMVKGLVADTVYPHRLGKPHEFASLVAELARNEYLNGATVRLDAAIRMPPQSKL